MNLEPRVIESIKRHKRKVLLLKSLMVAVLALALVLSIALCFWAYRTGSSSTDEHVRSHFEPAELRSFLILFIISSGTAVVIISMMIVITSRAPKSLFANRELNVREKEWARKFKNGLEGASIAMGVHPPKFVVTDTPGVAAFAFLDRRYKPSVAVTREALRVELSVDEAEALMADQLSHVVIGDLLKSLSFQKVLWISILPLMAVASFGIFLSVEALMNILPFLLTLIICGCEVGIMIFLARKLRKISFHNELLTDSIASKITGNPAALKNALIKLDGADLLGRVCSVFLQSTGPRFARKKAQGKVKKLGGEYLIDYEAGYSIDERVRNLEAIERGNWQAVQWE